MTKTASGLRKATDLKRAVDQRRREISSENLSMSIGELSNLFKERELDIHPEFQRVFRWSIEQKSRLIESLLLGIPLPPLYVAANETGIWEVIDGVQRLSTILEFLGELVGPISPDSDEFELKPPLKLIETKHLSQLGGVTYKEMDQTLRLEFKRTRLDVKVLARESSGTATGKFDLFERLNTYGQPLSPQELRNCILVSINSSFYKWLRQLAENPDFRECCILSENQLLERYDMDLALRFLTLRDHAIPNVRDVHDFLRDQMASIASDKTYDQEGEGRLFAEVFAYCNSQMGSDALRSWDSSKNSFRGGLSLAAFEGVALSLGKNWKKVKPVKDKLDLSSMVKKVWEQPEYSKGFSGLRARERMLRITPAVERVLLDELQRISPRKTRSARRGAT